MYLSINMIVDIRQFIGYAPLHNKIRNKDTSLLFYLLTGKK